METLIYIAHPDLAGSNSQSFLIEAAQALDHVDLVSVNTLLEDWDRDRERQRFLAADRIIFQFPLYWYQAPAALKAFIDALLEVDSGYDDFVHAIAGKELGLCLVVGVANHHYQLGGREGVTISTLLAPYQALANHLGMTYLQAFEIHQFMMLDAQDKEELLVRYHHFLKTGGQDFRSYQSFLLDQLQELDWNMDPSQILVLDNFLQSLEDQADELSELMEMTQGWEEI